MNRPKLMIMSGTPTEGFIFIGPFDPEEDPNEYAKTKLDVDWWLIELTPPFEDLTDGTP